MFMAALPMIPKSGYTQMSISQRKNEQNVTQPYNGTLLTYSTWRRESRNSQISDTDTSSNNAQGGSKWEVRGHKAPSAHSSLSSSLWLHFFFREQSNP